MNTLKLFIFHVGQFFHPVYSDLVTQLIPAPDLLHCRVQKRYGMLQCTVPGTCTGTFDYGTVAR